MPEDMCCNSGPDNESISDQKGSIAIKVDHERLPGNSNIGAVFKCIFCTPNSQSMIFISFILNFETCKSAIIYDFFMSSEFVKIPAPFKIIQDSLLWLKVFIMRGDYYSGDHWTEPVCLLLGRPLDRARVLTGARSHLLCWSLQVCSAFSFNFFFCCAYSMFNT